MARITTVSGCPVNAIVKVSQLDKGFKALLESGATIYRYGMKQKKK